MAVRGNAAALKLYKSNESEGCICGDFAADIEVSCAVFDLLARVQLKTAQGEQGDKVF